MSTSMDNEENHCDLNSAKDMWHMKARVIRKWKRAYPLRSLMLKQEEESGCTSQTVLSSQALIYPLRQEFIVGTQKKRVDELIVSEIQEPMFFVVVATIKSVEESYGWFYAACRKCNKKVLSKSEYLQNAEEVCEAILKLFGTALVCQKCEWECTSITPKFKLQIRVQDESGSVSFVMFDKDVMMIIGAAAWDIRERQLKQSNTKSLSLQLSRVVENKLAFKIDVSDYNLTNEYHVYTVVKICDDPVIIEELVDGYENVQDHSGEVIREVSRKVSVNLSESLQLGFQATSKDVVCVDATVDTTTSPNEKRSVDYCGNVNVGDQTSRSKRLKKKAARFES